MESATLKYAGAVCIVLIILLAMSAAGRTAQTLGPLISIPPSEFMKMPAHDRAVYVGGVIDGMTFGSYGYSAPEHDRFVRCARTITLGALSEKTGNWLAAHPKFSEGTASAIAATMGEYCKSKGF